METLTSICSNLKSVPECYVLPTGARPGNLVAPVWEDMPVVDLGVDLVSCREKIVEQIMAPSQGQGYFQLINHGISDKLIKEVQEVSAHFMELSAEEKAGFYSDDPKNSVRIGTSIECGEKIKYWRDHFRHLCYPLEYHIQSWPQKPSQYRDVMGQFSKEIRELGLWVLDVICEGLGLEKGYFSTQLSATQVIAINYYPPCPDPSVTLGLPPHTDPYLITLLLQGRANGLQTLMDGQWVAIQPLPDSIIVNFGKIIETITNGKIVSPIHRAVTNKEVGRVTVISYMRPSDDVGIKMSHSDQLHAPSNDGVIKPAKQLLNDSNPPALNGSK